MSEMEYESGMMNCNYVVIRVLNAEDEAAVLTVNPIGQFNPGGCEAFIYVKKDQVLALKTIEDLYEYLLKRIFFENLDIAISDLDDFSLGAVLEYTKALELSDDNNWWLPYFRRLEKQTEDFHGRLQSLSGDLKDLRLVAHEYHAAAGELCDFVDYTCAPEGDDNEEIRSFLIETLSPESDIDAIMNCFEDGCFYGNSFEGDEMTIVDFNDGSIKKSMTISNVQ